MALTRSQRQTREWPLLVLALALVCAISIPLWQWSQSGQAATHPWAAWTPERVGRLLLGPEQILCYISFAWAGLILLSRYLEVRRQRRALGLGLLPTDEGVRILPEDARPLQRKLDQLTGRGGPYILANMIRQGLSCYAVSRSGRDVGETVRLQADVELGRLVTSMATVHYLAWAIPALGFLGTVRGLAMTFTLASEEAKDIPAYLKQATNHLNVAFDCTLVALALSVVVMFLLHSVQRDEEQLVIDCQQYCQENLILRLYNPELVHES